MISLPEGKKVNGIYYLSDRLQFSQLEKSYLDARKKEGRIYSNEILAKLPFIHREHPLINEWRIRQASMKSLIKYFLRYKNLEILDLGCGNGWLANRISGRTDNFVFAMDVNKTELEQGACVFLNNNRLKFLYGDIFEKVLPEESLDTVIISSAIQYFKEPKGLIKRLFKLLKPSGEIHILDTNFYNGGELEAAKQRTALYYKKLGYPDMARFYHNHKWAELDEFNYKIMNKLAFKIGRRINKVFNLRISPFPWIIIKSADN